MAHVVGLDRNSRFAERRRVEAMRLVTNVINFHVPNDPVIMGNWRRTNLFAPSPKDWPFIDMDPMFAGDEWFALSDEKYNAQWPIDQAIALPMSKTDFRIAYCKTISPKEMRKYQNVVYSTKMASIGRMDFVGGRYDYGGTIVSLIGGKWVHAIRSTKHQIFENADTADDLSGMMAVSVGAALRYRYDWSVILNFPTCRARFSTDATGALRMFKDRNLEPFGSRRAPLLHWVAKHWRQRRSVPADMIEVRKHLRGRSDFEWRGFPVTIIPAEFEVERALSDVAA